MPRTDFPPVSLDEWRDRVRDELDGASPETLARRSLGGLELEPLYAEEHRRGAIAPTPGRPRAPRLCPAVEAVEAAAIGEEIAEHLTGGAAGVWLDARRGDALADGSDLAVAFDDERLVGATVWLDAAGTAERWPGLWADWLQADGLDAHGVRLRLGLDPLGLVARRGGPARRASDPLAELPGLVREVSERLPGSTAVVVSTLPYQEAGADLVSELGFAVATLLEYARAAASDSLGAAQLLSRTTLRLAVGCQVFPEIAKLRAARVLWRAVAGALGLDRVPDLELHAVGSRRTYSRREPRLNLLRATQQAVAAACGGAAAISLPAFDAVDRAASETGRRLARTIPLVLEHEGGLGRVGDPAAGSYLVEAATTRLAEDAWRLAREIESTGGMWRELVSGRARERVDAAWRARRQAYEEGRAGLVGVTAYVDEAAAVLPSEPSDRQAAASEPGAETIEPFAPRRDAATYERGGGERGGGA